MNQRNVVPGVLLIVLGVYLGFVQLTGIGAEAIVAVIGIGFIVAYALTRVYGFLVPGGIMTGLGLGILWETELGSGGGAVVIGLGLGFVAIYLIDALVQRSEALWWPIIPGGILVTIGVLIEAGQERWLDGTSLLAPLVLVIIGAALIIAQLRGRAHEPRPTDGDRGTGAT